MHQVKKGNQWHFGMKAHIGVDAESGLVHPVFGAAANVNDVTQGHALLHREESIVFPGILPKTPHNSSRCLRCPTSG